MASDAPNQSSELNPYQDIVPVGERVLIDDRPHIVFVFTQMWRWILIGILAWGLMRWFGGRWGYPIMISASNGALVIVGLRFLLGLLDWSVRRHILTDARIIAKFGILRTVTTDIPLRRIQHTVMVRPLAERLFGIGSLGMTSAGTGSVDLVWRGVEHPEQVLETIRKQADRMSSHGSGKQVTPVIGIVGGIGSGKSTVSRAFGKLGCTVSDSDQSVREIMGEPRVIAQFVEWWGQDVLLADGTIDRGRVAQIVFDQPYERRRLEGFIHPMVHQRRRDLIESAIAQGVVGVIVDAPLLFEAGVDAE